MTGPSRHEKAARRLLEAFGHRKRVTKNGHEVWSLPGGTITISARTSPRGWRNAVAQVRVRTRSRDVD